VSAGLAACAARGLEITIADRAAIHLLAECRMGEIGLCRSPSPNETSRLFCPGGEAWAGNYWLEHPSWNRRPPCAPSRVTWPASLANHRPALAHTGRIERNRAMHIAEQLGNALRDRYRIDREIGSGGMATVYLAQDVRHERFVALKVLNPELGAVLG